MQTNENSLQMAVVPQSFLNKMEEKMETLENILRDKLKVAGGRWDPEKKVWHVLYGSIRGDTDLEERILPD